MGFSPKQALPVATRSRLAVAAAALILCIVSAAPAGAQQERQPAPETADTTSVWTYSLYKTITYETFANLADIPLYYVVLGGAAPTSALFNTVNVLTAGATYYVYEVGWNLYGPPIRGQPPAAIVDAEVKKTLVYRVVSTGRNLALGYAFTASAPATVGFALISNVVDGALYVANEYAWYAYGPAVASDEVVPFPELMAEFGVSAPTADDYRVPAIALGAVGGAILVSAATGGLAAPVLALAPAAAPSGAAYLGGLAATVIGAIGGGALVDWLLQ
jgi:uncharacterized membrane protein